MMLDFVGFSGFPWGINGAKAAGNLRLQAEDRALDFWADVLHYGMAQETAGRLRAILDGERGKLKALEAKHAEKLATWQGKDAQVKDLKHQLGKLTGRDVQRQPLMDKANTVALEAQPIAAELIGLDGSIETLRQATEGMASVLRGLEAVRLPDLGSAPGLVEFLKLALDQRGELDAAKPKKRRR